MIQRAVFFEGWKCFGISFIIDQFIMGGGKSMWMIDPTDCKMDSIFAGKAVAEGMGRPLNIEDQLFRYGVRLNNNVIMDVSSTKIPIPSGMRAGQVQYQLKSEENNESDSIAEE